MIQNRKHFIDELESLNEKVTIMGIEVIKTYRNVVKACESNNDNLATHIMENDKLINDIEISINVDAYLLIAKQCPVASDLRRIITALKISNDLERIGDYAVNIAKYIMETTNDNKQHISVIIKLVNYLIKMLEGIMIAFETENIELALEVNDLDEELDKKYENEVKNIIIL